MAQITKDLAERIARKLAAEIVAGMTFVAFSSTEFWSHNSGCAGAPGVSDMTSSRARST
jgi:hypothetical protein